MYVRFAIPSDQHRPEPHVATGIFCASGRLQDAVRFEQWQDDLLQEASDWFNATFPYPKKVATRAIFWFRPEAREAISRVWRMSKLIESVGVPVRAPQRRRLHIRIDRESQMRRKFTDIAHDATAVWYSGATAPTAGERSWCTPANAPRPTAGTPAG